MSFPLNYRHFHFVHRVYIITISSICERKDNTNLYSFIFNHCIFNQYRNKKGNKFKYIYNKYPCIKRGLGKVAKEIDTLP